jgi:hypothetical protein
LDEITPPPLASEARPGCRFQRPADYYSAPPARGGRRIPRGVQIGCGLAGLIFVAVLFVASTFVTSEGAGQLLAFLFGRLQGELLTMDAPDVSDEQRKALDAQLETLIERAERNEVNLVALQPLLRRMNESVRDKRLTPEEVGDLTAILEEINQDRPATEVRENQEQ